MTPRSLKPALRCEGVNMMSRHQRQNHIYHRDEAIVPTRDVLLAVSGALRGDRRRVRLLVAKAKGRIEKRLERELRSLGKRKPSHVRQKQKIQGARLAPPQRLPRPAPPVALKARLPDGRMIKLGHTPAAARRRDMQAFRRVSSVNTKQAYDAIVRNGKAIDRLAAAQQELTDRLAKLQANGDLALLRGIVEGLASLERRMEGVKRRQDKALGVQKRTARKRFARQAQRLKSQTRAAQIQKLHGIVMSAQTAAYGTKGKLLTANNLLLAANQLGWSYAPQITQALGLSKPGSTSPLDWLAPLGNLVVSRALLGSRQHERFVTGVATDFDIKGPPPAGNRFGEKRLSLQKYIAPAEWETFRRRKYILVTTVVLHPRSEIEPGIWSTGEVKDGQLTIRITALGEKIVQRDAVVAWTVDTRRDDG